MPIVDQSELQSPIHLKELVLYKVPTSLSKGWSSLLSSCRSGANQLPPQNNPMPINIQWTSTPKLIGPVKLKSQHCHLIYNRLALDWRWIDTEQANPDPIRVTIPHLVKGTSTIGDRLVSAWDEYTDKGTIADWNM